MNSITAKTMPYSWVWCSVYLETGEINEMTDMLVACQVVLEQSIMYIKLN